MRQKRLMHSVMVCVASAAAALYNQCMFRINMMLVYRQ